MMKWLFIVSAFIVLSCRSHSSMPLSADQQGLLILSQDFNRDYKDTSDSRGRQKLITDYELKLQDYLKRQCSSMLENMQVKMKKCEEDGKGRIHAEFVDKNNEYVFDRVYDSSSEMKGDTIYKFVKSLPEGTDITVRFLFSGNVKINDPETASAGGFHIQVIPTALVKVFPS
jgi:hypothetical protein